MLHSPRAGPPSPRATPPPPRNYPGASGSPPPGSPSSNPSSPARSTFLTIELRPALRSFFPRPRLEEILCLWPDAEFELRLDNLLDLDDPDSPAGSDLGIDDIDFGIADGGDNLVDDRPRFDFDEERELGLDPDDNPSDDPAETSFPLLTPSSAS
ncbi:hypothetical protein FRC12_000892 [Ceratobasidium sp. 428]|nr:hypothetical protein FRC12_000892 [Ceratobasidium sp. 428]